MADTDIRKMYKAAVAERNGYVDEAQLIADLTIPTLSPKVSEYQSGNVGPQKLNRPKSDAGARGVKSFAATLVSTLAPPNVRFFRFISDPSLNLSEQDDAIVAEIFKQEERRVDMFLAKHGFLAFSNSTMKRLLVEGNNGVKIDPNKGFMLYPLRAIVVKRSFGAVQYVIFEEQLYVNDPVNKGMTKRICQYIHVDYVNKTVSTQREDEEKPRLTDESVKQYFVTVCDYPTNENYARSFYSDHYGLLKSIDFAATSLEEAMANCAWNWISFTGPSTISVSQIAQIKNRQVVRLPSHDMVQFQGTGGKINDWQFIAQRLTEQEEALQYISAAGLVARAGSIQTATEVQAILQELAALTGTVSMVISDTFFKPLIEGVMEILGIRDSLREKLLQQERLQVTDDILEKLVQPIVVSGVPAMAREQDAERMLMGISKIAQTFGPQTLAMFDAREVAKEYLDGLKVNTEPLFVKNDVMAQLSQQGVALPPGQVPPEIMQQMMAQQQQLPPQQ